MKQRPLHIFLTLLLATFLLFAQNRGRQPGGAIGGQVYDSVLKVPVEYANIVLNSQRDSSQVTGTITNPDGKFELTGIRPGQYYVEIYFIGYETKRIEGVVLRPPDMTANLGDIPLVQTAISMEGVEVEGERAPISFQIDKKVIHVDQQHTVVSGSAVDVLENVPSVTVDIEGNVSLRGSGSFRVLIDGRPTILDPAEALDQIPASTIEDIEIITNPSARYDPEGTAGIINVVLKKNKQAGRSGIANLDGGVHDKYGGDFLVEFKNDLYRATLGVDYNHRIYTGEDLEENRTTQQGITSFIYSEGERQRGRESFGLRAGMEFNLGARDYLGISGRFGDRTSQRDSELSYDQWREGDARHNLYSSISDRQRDRRYYRMNMSYQHRFARKGHVLNGEVSFRYGDSDEVTVNELRTGAGAITEGQRSTEAGPGKELEVEFDYTHPLGEKSKFEAGYQNELDRDEERTGLGEYSPEVGDYVPLAEFSNATRYQRDEHAVYALYAGEWGRLGYQGGLRGEFTDRAIDVTRTRQRFTIDRWDFFPSFHMSYKFAKGQQMMASYTRRIDRPGGWQLEPFQTWIDAYTVRVGNPALQPEYIDSYEIGYQTFFGKTLFSSEAYFRRTHNKVERVRSVYDENITLHSVENIGRDYAFGSELMLNIDLAEAWNVNLLGNLYNYRVEGELLGENFSRESLNWGWRMSNTVKIGSSTQIQVDGNYRSPTVSSQGRREGFFYSSAAVKYEILPKQLSVTLQARDLFSTARYEYTSEGPGFYSYNYFTRESPLVMLNIRYNFNNYKQDRRGERGNGDNGGGGEEF